MALIIITLVAYWNLQTHEFINFDDSDYVSENVYVIEGVTRQGILWALKSFHSANWHPVTWISHMVDCQLFGLRAGMHHIISLFLHVANCILLFVVLKRMTGTCWPSAFVAALFGIHPLHVESVAWVAERKDVLSTFFWIVTMWCYLLYVEGPGIGRYLLVIGSFILGLMAKPMLVTLPFVLLLLDYWPLGRLRLARAGKSDVSDAGKSSVFFLLREKTPLFVLAAGSCIITFIAQQQGGAVSSLELIPLYTRISNVLVSYAGYLWKMLWPQNMALLYPFPSVISPWKTISAGVLLVLISLLVLKAGKVKKYLAVGWFWYLGTLVPVIGLVQVGAQSMADRYTYVPLIGMFIMFSWGADELAKRWRLKKSVLGVSAAVLIAALVICTRVQVGHWKDSLSLFEHTVNVTSGNCLAHINLGDALDKAGRIDEAIRQFSEVLKYDANHTKAHYNLGVSLAKKGMIKEAIEHYSKALRTKPDYEEAHYNLGVVLMNHGSLDEAIRHYNKAIDIKPDVAVFHYNIGVALARKGDFPGAVRHYDKAMQLDPDLASGVYYNRACISSRQNNVEESVGWLSLAVEHGFKGWDLIKTDKDLNNIRDSSYYKKIVHGNR